MATTQFTTTTESNGTSNLTHLLNERDQSFIQAIRPHHLKSIFGDRENVDIPEKGYTDPEWYFQASDGCVWGIGWRYGQTRLRGRGVISRGKMFFVHPSPDSAAEFIDYLSKEL